MEIIFFIAGLATGAIACLIITIAQRKVLQERLLNAQQALHTQNSLRQEFQGLASEVMQQKAETLQKANQEQMGAILAPLNSSIKDFKARFESVNTEQTKQKASLEAQIRELVSTTSQVGQEANNLASALKGDNKKLGNWGEMILETILQRSGLIKDEHYKLQATQEDGQRPDVVIYLPGDKQVIVDSKASLSAYDNYCSAQNDAEQTAAVAAHLKSLKAHIDGLSAKNYQKSPNSAGFVMMFIPIEPAYVLAMHADTSLWEYAFKKHVVLISPTNLITSIKLIDDLWRTEAQSKNAQEIVRKAESMFEKFVGLTETMQALGKSISGAQNAYDKALGQFCTGRGNVIKQAKELKSMGLKSSKKPALEAKSSAGLLED